MANKNLTLRTQNPLIEGTKKYFSSESRWQYKQPHLNINVSKNLEDRSLRFMVAFIDAMETKGHSVIVEEGKTIAIAIVLEEKFDFYIREKSTRVSKVEKYGLSSILIPNGKLCFQYHRPYPKKEWTDSNFVPIEDKIPDIIAYLEKEAVKKKQDRKEREEWQRKYEEEQRKKQEFQERKTKELSDFKAMFTLSNRYQKAIELRNYIETVKSHSMKDGAIPKELQVWIEWAKKKADWFDPFIDAPDDYLNDVDKTKFDV